MNAPRKRKHVIERNYVPVGDFLKAARLKAGLTQKEVSQVLGYSSSQFISNFECGIAVPPLKKLKVLVHLYGMNVNALLDIILDTEREVMLTEIGSRGKKK